MLPVGGPIPARARTRDPRWLATVDCWLPLFISRLLLVVAVEFERVVWSLSAAPPWGLSAGFARFGDVAAAAAHHVLLVVGGARPPRARG